MWRQQTDRGSAAPPAAGAPQIYGSVEEGAGFPDRAARRDAARDSLYPGANAQHAAGEQKMFVDRPGGHAELPGDLSRGEALAREAKAGALAVREAVARIGRLQRRRTLH